MSRHLNMFVRGVFFIFITLVLSFSARALTFNVTYDASVTNFGTLAQVQTAFGAAAQTIQSLYTNAIIVNITVYSANAGPFGYIDLGESQSSYSFGSSFKYPQLTNALRAARTTLADSNSVASLPASDPTGGTYSWCVPRAESKALGLFSISANNTNVDGEIGFATDETFTFDPNNRAVPGAIDFIGVAEHEITEVMGRSTLDLGTNGYFPYDLFRFTSNGVRSFDPNASSVYFSVDNGATALKYFYPDINSGDIQDWQSSTPPDSFNATVTDGYELTLSAADLTSLDILGYKLNYQPPRLQGTNLGNGNFQLNFTNTPGTSYTELASTNVSLSVSNWTVLGTTTETQAGQFQFTDSPASKLRFYRVRLN